MKNKGIVLAAGDGKRMNSKIPKIMHKISGFTIISHVVRAVLGSGINDIAVIISDENNNQLINELRNQLPDCNIEFILQHRRLGTGHAVMQARRYIENSENTLILCGDIPLISSKTLKDLIDIHEKHQECDSTILCAQICDPTGYGRIIFVPDSQDGYMQKIERIRKIERIIEEKDATPTQKLINTVNSGIYVFKSEKLLMALSNIDNNNAQNEYYLTDTIDKINNVQSVNVENSEEIFGVNDRDQLYKITKIMNFQNIDCHMSSGVTFVDINTTYIDCNVEIGIDTIIQPGCHIKTGSKIGSNCNIGPNTTIENCEIGNDCFIEHSVLRSSKIGNKSIIGPFAYLRPACDIKENVKIGSFVEVKNSNIDNYTKIPHLSYIGDADIGQKVNFGCGSIVVNYDGSKKYRSRIDDFSFIGSNSNLVSPVHLESNCFVAAGSTITQDIPKNSLAIARSRQINKKDWVK